MPPRYVHHTMQTTPIFRIWPLRVAGTFAGVIDMVAGRTPTPAPRSFLQLNRQQIRPHSIRVALVHVGA